MPPKRPPSKSSDAAKKASSRKDVASTAAAAPRKTPSTPVTQLGPNDVLMGRGALATDYEGNLRLRDIVQRRYAEYSSALKRNRKHRVAEEIFQEVLTKGGRFLQSADTVKFAIDHSTLPRNEAVWYSVEDTTILVAKVKQLLRDVPRRKQSAPGFQGEESHIPEQVYLTQAGLIEAGAHNTNFSGSQHHQVAVNAQQQINQPATGYQPMGLPFPGQHSNATAQSFMQQQQHPNFPFPPGMLSLLGQPNGAAILQLLMTTGGGTQAQSQNNTLMSLSSANRGSQTNAARDTGTGQTGENSTHSTDLSLLVSALLQQSQNREHQNTSMLNQIQSRSEHGNRPPSPAANPASLSNPLAWLSIQLQQQQQQQRETGDNAPVPAAAAPGMSSYLAEMLRQQEASRQSSHPSHTEQSTSQAGGGPAVASTASSFSTHLHHLLRQQQQVGGSLQPSAQSQLQRLMSAHSQNQQSTQEEQPEDEGSSESTLARLLRSLQGGT
eukprot:scaffold3851_cov162-Amphora_coffeaeformis.AAC.4